LHVPSGGRGDGSAETCTRGADDWRSASRVLVLGRGKRKHGRYPARHGGNAKLTSQGVVESALLISRRDSHKPLKDVLRNLANQSWCLCSQRQNAPRPRLNLANCMVSRRRWWRREDAGGSVSYGLGISTLVLVLYKVLRGRAPVSSQGADDHEQIGPVQRQERTAPQY
jgi:hypothetical protein